MFSQDSLVVVGSIGLGVLLGNGLTLLLLGGVFMLSGGKLTVKDLEIK